MSTEEQSREQVERIAMISSRVRDALRKALPTPPEQFFTVSVPGKVVNFDTFLDGRDPTTGKLSTAFPPLSVQLAEARLVDDMPALSGIALGPTGKSVARSYEAALTKLTPAGSTIGIDPKDTDSADEKRYRKAMAILTGPHPRYADKSLVEVYKEKQTTYTEAIGRKTNAFQHQLDFIKQDVNNNTAEKQREAFNLWVQANAKTYRNYVQAAYMDWVTNGKKEEVEYWFAVVDNSTAMSRVEGSKEAMRASVIQDSDGAVEYEKVSLVPDNWAWIAQQKIAKGDTGPDTPQSLALRISRLTKINLLLEQVIKNKKPTDKSTSTTSAVSGTSAPQTATSKAGQSETPSTVSDAVTKFLTATDNYETALAVQEKAQAEKKADPNSKSLASAEKDFEDARKKLNEEFEKLDKEGVAALGTTALENEKQLFENNAKLLVDLKTQNEGKIVHYRQEIRKMEGGVSSGVAYQDKLALEAGIGPDLPAAVGQTATPDFWTSISLEVSSSSSASQSNTSSTSYSAGASYSWGWSIFGGGVGGSASHSESSANAAKQMAECKTSVSFDCMRVDIQRGWLRPELFYDKDLASNTPISPGPAALAAMMDPSSYPNHPASRESARLEKDWNLFPMFPTAFILAANVVIELHGNTSSVQSHFSTSSTSASAEAGWGPFKVSSNYSHSETHMDSKCEATATGCRITVKSPQIIGWVSQILPALPRITPA